MTAVQFGYFGLRLSDHWPAWAAVGAPTALGMTLPPWYEELAAPARAWFYPPHGLMLSHTPRGKPRTARDRPSDDQQADDC